jgi:AcrR family transcriptional regulator
MSGLRQLHKQRTRAAISQAAITLFLEHGFDAVPVSDVAAAAEVSKPTLFKYFATKEDLVLHRIADHGGGSARIAAEAPGAPVTALRDAFLAGLERHDPVTGLSEEPEVLAYYELIFATPRLLARLFHFMVGEEERLAAALGGGLPARLLAAQVMGVQRVLSEANRKEIIAGRTAAEVYPEAVRAAKRGFGALPQTP